MLATALGLALQDAAEALEFDVTVTADPSDPTAIEIGEELVSLLSRTVRKAALGKAYDTAAIEVVIGKAGSGSNLPKLFVSIQPDEAVIGSDLAPERCAEIPHILSVLVACYISAKVMQTVLKERLPFHVPSPLRIPFDQLGIDARAYGEPVNIGRAYLAGAGAIGNGFLWAARHLKVHGQLEIADDDFVSSGNLNRQIWFTKTDIDHPKAERLAANAKAYFPNLKLVERKQRLQDLSEKCDGPWLARTFIAVDSRRARRKIQNEFPGEVFDASTTDIREVVIHYHKQPTNNACLSCIYETDKEEASREQHIADHLGVSLAEVRQERISAASAERIAQRMPKLDAVGLVGLAYDSLFKQLCGAGELKTLEGRRIFAPFAFVSVLAGTLLALEMLRRIGEGESKKDFNYWRVSPWYPPLGRRQIIRPAEPECEFCGDRILRSVNAALWKTEPIRLTRE
jgi:molybdopterin/thiamine biosynthesis adenylyltransferase